MLGRSAQGSRRASRITSVQQDRGKTAQRNSRAGEGQMWGKSGAGAGKWPLTLRGMGSFWRDKTRKSQGGGSEGDLRMPQRHRNQLQEGVLWRLCWSPERPGRSYRERAICSVRDLGDLGKGCLTQLPKQLSVPLLDNSSRWAWRASPWQTPHSCKTNHVFFLRVSSHDSQIVGM